MKRISSKLKHIQSAATFLFLIWLSSTFLPAYALDCSPGSLVGAGQQAPSPYQMLCPILRLFNVLLILAGGVLVIIIVIGALKMAVSLDDPKGLKSARDTWIFAVIGVFVVIGVFAILRILNTAFGLGLDNYFGAGGVNNIFNRINDVWRTLLGETFHIYE